MECKICMEDVTQKRKPNTGSDQKANIKILCFELSQYTQATQFCLCCLGVFVFFVIYGYLQELIFTLQGFQPYGWFLTLIQFGYYTIFGLIEKFIRQLKGRQIPLKTYFLLAFLTLGTMGFSNSSLGYLNYPTQVIFKCCKLVPVMIGSILIQGKKYGPLDYAAAVCMCLGLTLFILADSQVSPNFNIIGVVMISLALLCDAAIGNVQERAMREHNASNAEVVLYSYGIGFCCLFIIMLLSGHLFKGIEFCYKHPTETYGYALLFSLSGYLGIQIVLNLVLTCGAPTAATVTTARKAVTIVVSYLFFGKAFTIQYVWSGLIVVLGIYMNVYSKRNPTSFKEILSKVDHLINLYLTSRFHSSRHKSTNKRLLTHI